MKIICKKTDLAKAVQTVAKAVPAKATTYTYIYKRRHFSPPSSRRASANRRADRGCRP